jgi:hypothetical protein
VGEKDNLPVKKSTDGFAWFNLKGNLAAGM